MVMKPNETAAQMATGELRPSRVPARFLVFTSAGDRGKVRHWVDGPREFDLWISYYGDADDPLQGIADYYVRRKGSKFQNLHHAFQTSPEVLSLYEAIMVADDDIIISAKDLNRLFHIREAYDLWALQPAFTTWGKVSWPITRVRRNCLLRYTSFIEMTCPLFRYDKLADFMAVYDPVLVGWGCDWWFLHTMGVESKGHIAVVDEISCLNPRDQIKGGREIDKLQPAAVRAATWARVKAQQGIRIDELPMVEYDRLYRHGLGRLMGAAVEGVEQTLFRSASTLWHGFNAIRHAARNGTA
jgi:hypothetical protein